MMGRSRSIGPGAAADPAAHARGRRIGFTLIELLVVIAILAVLISILLPSVIAARRQAKLIRCQANLREVAVGCLLHAHDHRGYLPLAGLLTAAAASQTLAAGLNDTERQRYTYAPLSPASAKY